MQIAVITQARYSSSRLPGKVLKKLGHASVLDLHLKRIKRSKKINIFMVATTHETEAKEIERIALNQNFKCFKGDLNDVLERFYLSVKDLKPEIVVRVTSDCPLIDPIYIDDLINKFLNAKVDYASNCLVPTLPDGMDVEVFSFKSLEDAWMNASLQSQREHVTSYIRDCGKYKILSVEYPQQAGDIRMTLDTEEDYEVLRALVENCGEDAHLETYLAFLKLHPQIVAINSKHLRNETYKK